MIVQEGKICRVWERNINIVLWSIGALGGSVIELFVISYVGVGCELFK